MERPTDREKAREIRDLWREFMKAVKEAKTENGLEVSIGELSGAEMQMKNPTITKKF